LTGGRAGAWATDYLDSRYGYRRPIIARNRSLRRRNGTPAYNFPRHISQTKEAAEAS